MADVHSGSWFGLPDFGITELFSGNNRTSQGGSNLFGPSSAQTPPNQPPTNTPPVPVNSPTISTGATTTATKPTQPQQQQSTSGMSFDQIYNQFYQGWDKTAAMADYKANPNKFAGQMGGGSGEPDYSAQIDAIYGPAYQSLNDRSNFLTNTALPNLNSQTDAEVEKSLNDLNSQIIGVKTDADTQRNILFQQNQKALGDILRSYLALQQQGQARFGQGSSTGQAVSELTGQEYLRNRGQLDLAYTNETGKIADTILKADMFATQKTQELDTWKKTQVQSNNQRIQEELLQINNARYQLDSDKAAKRFEALQAGVQRAQQIQDMYTAQQQELDIWKQKVDYQTQEDFKKLSAGFAPVNQIAAPQSQYLPATSAQVNPNNLLASLPQLRSTKKTDEFGRIIEPNLYDYLG